MEYTISELRLAQDHIRLISLGVLSLRTLEKLHSSGNLLAINGNPEDGELVSA